MSMGARNMMSDTDAFEEFKDWYSPPVEYMGPGTSPPVYRPKLGYWAKYNEG
jgi:hypothetical protein